MTVNRARARRILAVAAAASVAASVQGCNVLTGLLTNLGPVLQPGQSPGQVGGPQGGPVAHDAIKVHGSALFPHQTNPKQFVPIAGTRVEILDLTSGAVLATGQADPGGRFAIEVKLNGRAPDTVFGIRAKATRSSGQYRVAADVTFEVLGLGGVAEASVDPASTAVAAKIFEEAKTKGTSVKVDLQTFKSIVAKVSAALTPEDITRISTGQVNPADVFEDLAGSDPSLGSLVESVFRAAPSTGATAAPAPTRTPAGATPAPTEEPDDGPSEEPTEEPSEEPTPDRFSFDEMGLPESLVLGVPEESEGEDLLPATLDILSRVPEEYRHMLHDVEWSSDNPDIAAFDDPGILSAKAAGYALVRLKKGDHEFLINVSVLDGGAAAVEVN